MVMDEHSLPNFHSNLKCFIDALFNTKLGHFVSQLVDTLMELTGILKRKKKKIELVQLIVNVKT